MMFQTMVDTPAVLGALVDAAIACGLTSLRFCECELGPQSATHIARLLRKAPLSMLSIVGQFTRFGCSPTCVVAHHVALGSRWAVGRRRHWQRAGEPTLQEISLDSNQIGFDDPHNTVGACLSKLVTANSPSLHTLSLEYCKAGDDVLFPVLAALASNTTLRTVLLHGNEVSAPFVRQSIRANTGLREFKVANLYAEYRFPELSEAEALVAKRR